MSSVFVTTSWDDGHPLDLRIAEMLSRYGMTGTFYVPICHPWRPRLSVGQLRELSSAGFEIGSHGMTHKKLVGLSQPFLTWEIAESKSQIEQILGARVRTFCYPIGGHDGRVIKEVERAGYEGGRTTRMLSTRGNFDPLKIPTTIQAYRHNARAYLKNLLRRGDPRDIAAYWTCCNAGASWVEIGKRLFDRALREGGVWHLYGHSWEIEQHGIWRELDEMLAYVGSRANVRYVTTADTLHIHEPSHAGASCLRSSAG
ncbi:MAG TPA: polysaccharide deacetylase family protein [Terriglobales bacterium]|nr:polysaccharide deacetylase family protein [Terriglobales bacterium]